MVFLFPSRVPVSNLLNPSLPQFILFKERNQDSPHSVPSDSPSLLPSFLSFDSVPLCSLGHVKHAFLVLRLQVNTATLNLVYSVIK